MIGQIKGIIIAKQAPDLLVDVQGIGYEVLVSLGTFFDIPEIGGAVTLHTHFVVREDAQLLFGFATLEERALFRQLIKVNGVGPKMALAILSGMSASEFALAVHNNDIATLVKLPGVGKKTAERLVIEMRDKVDIAQINDFGSATAGKHPDIKQEAESALTALGYKPQDAVKMISRVSDEEITSTEQLIRRALKNMVSR
ncbi:MAG: Holliday junction branch migration protein RuvA [Pseudomonadales bacterium]|jgi:Holliday junction DNA helicase RuvA|nr:Holliday junction branch migration protein RuvA [SAR92 clade bacterium]MDB9978526.1 Holliday junction branch migration protein RuvA [Porticoccaceae bacterium]|tara:strand:+ start:686 stop:1282 length:597 start_codon:yes stop_codon:yes gene_type:complete